ncbi:CaiB/BaiF CoA transferase family protein [Enterocloster aldenensis]|uniref:CaiB/BaiF CoA transferase family protein n=1 Tax=Enterocloster aldenensis TaxID=358742 RepID=UPI00402706CB
MTENVFAGFTILDHTRYLLGGYATQVFADLGAEVIKIEEISKGDLCRDDAPRINGVSHYFSALNRNKKSLSLNLKSKEGREAYLKLLGRADVVIENFRPGVMKRLGIDYSIEKKIKPGIIHCSLTGFGQDDPRSLKAFHDINFQALSGYLSLNGGKTSPIHFVDLSTAMVAVQSIMAALLQRKETGQGAFCDIRMFDSFVWWNSILDARYQFLGNGLTEDTLDFPVLAYNVYETADNGFISVGMLEDKFWDGFLSLNGLEELKPFKLSHPKEAPEAFEMVDKLFRSRTLDQWKKWLKDKDICAMWVMDKTEAVNYIMSENPGLMEYCHFPCTGETLQTRIPQLISTIPVSLKNAIPAPKLGEHNDVILKSLGYSEEEVLKMAETGACGLIQPCVSADKKEEEKEC